MSRPSLAADESAVSDVVGNILIVGITVLMAVALSAIVLALPGPVDTTQPTLSVFLNPGPNPSWGGGDENVSIRHMGGERLLASSTTIRIRGVLPERTYEHSSLGGVFATPSGFNVGETWFSNSQSITVTTTSQVQVQVVVHRNSGSVLVTNAHLFPGAT